MPRAPGEGGSGRFEVYGKAGLAVENAQTMIKVSSLLAENRIALSASVNLNYRSVYGWVTQLDNLAKI